MNPEEDLTMLKGVVMRSSGVVDGFESEKQNLRINAAVDREPAELKLENRGNVISGRLLGDDRSSRILDEFEFMEGFVWKTKE